MQLVAVKSMRQHIEIFVQAQQVTAGDTKLVITFDGGVEPSSDTRPGSPDLCWGKALDPALSR